MTKTVAKLPLVTETQRDQILSALPTPEAHRALMHQIPAMSLIETGGHAADTLEGPVTVAAWNLERCLFPKASADHLRPFAPDVVLVSEADKGMARTGQRNTMADMASHLGMAYAYGVEFHELDLGGATERSFCTDDYNTEGWHGNAILSRAPFERLELIRLDDHGHWFVPDQNAGDPGQPRVGGRMAIAAVIKVDGTEVCFVSTHLESNADAPHRNMQMMRLLDAIDDFAPGMPVVIGGDLNTGNHMPPDFSWEDETLFDTARERGYSWDANAPGFTTRPSLITPHPDRTMKLDWFCSRGVTGANAQILPSLDPTGRPLSDHDAVLAQFTLP
ncbi:endonuclease/exonuclease/phosphatase family metal-dependent hydrolase [Yoonia maritima]|uniref:Endonuclease/exonuclease/phosphatase family metal-dependent hydrolase n=1 Tax=Yoonia maritima TaxID=1435347 RepID=A0A2T0W082_9RHOB|nr:endonuclease/exonuclease/phosphatase family protein [Yoonia maritima]PRY78169.1 endonuclease/exonuclease/phosphatase family metal-dependent hydrolase [Yoonia maritima]